MILRALAALAAISLTLGLCRFTVRDVGFVDLGDPGYRYYALVADADSSPVSAACRTLAETTFLDTNVEFEILDPDGSGGHSALRHVGELNLQRFPTTVLVHPDGHAIELPLAGSVAEVAADVFESVVSSQIRSSIIEAVLGHYCAVLLVECDDSSENEQARKAVRAAFAEIEKVFDKMPKDVGELPELIVLPRAQQSAEEVLLWSLGIDARVEHPVAVALTGRGRQIGPILNWPDVTQDSVLDVISKVGESCECGLDRTWMRGLRLPLRWDGDTRQQAADLLGFDPESPLVMAEISGIVARGPNGELGESGAEPSVADMLLGYTEISLALDDFVGAEAVPADVNPIEASAVEEDVVVSDGARASGSDSESESDAAEAGETPVVGRWIWLPLGGLLILNLGFAAYIFLRSRRS